MASGASWVVWTTGFERRGVPLAEGERDASEAPLPAARWKGIPIDLASAPHEAHTTNALSSAKGLYGIGLGFPAIAIDPEGLEERWVGFGGDAIKLVERIAADAAREDTQEIN